MADMEAMDKLRHARIQNMKNIVTGKGKVDHIPNIANIYAWKYYDAGYGLSETLQDYDKILDSLEQFYKRYAFDSCADTGWRNPLKVLEDLGNDKSYIVDDEQYALIIKDQCYMQPEEYDQLIENPRKYLWETYIPRKFPVFAGKDREAAFRACFQKYMEFAQTIKKTSDIGNKYGVAGLISGKAVLKSGCSGYEMLFNGMRGIKGLSIDLRRCPDKVQAASKALEDIYMNPEYEAALAGPSGSDPEALFDLLWVLLGHTILNRKQFEKFYWPYLKKFGEFAEEKDKIGLIFAEGNCKMYWDLLRQLPENRFVLLCEQEDVFEVKQALPNMVIAGGFPTTLLGKGTPEECVAYAKRLVEEIGGEDHRYVFSTGKMIQFPNDCKRENLEAVCEYISTCKY